MSSTCLSMWNGTRHEPPSPVPMVAVRWLMRTITPVTLRPSRSLNVAVSPRWNSRALVAAVTGSGGGSPCRSTCMEITRRQFAKIEHCLPTQRGRTATEERGPDGVFPFSLRSWVLDSYLRPTGAGAFITIF